MIFFLVLLIFLSTPSLAKWVCLWVSEYQWWSRINFSWKKLWVLISEEVLSLNLLWHFSPLWVPAPCSGSYSMLSCMRLFFLSFFPLTWVLFFVFKSAQITERDKHPHFHSWPPGWSHQVHGMYSFPSHSVADYWWSRQVNFQVLRYGKLLQYPLQHNSLNSKKKVWERVWA